MRTSTGTIFALGALAISACATDAPTESQAASALTCPPPTLTNQALVETNGVVMARFGLSRTLGQILTSTNSLSTVSGLWTQFRTTYQTNCGPTFDPHGYGLTCRPDITTALQPFDPTLGGATQFTPVGLFNRFDLAPQNGADCGEYRIIYAAQGLGGTGNRAFMIFEARLPNPTPSAGLAGCIPVADFWASLSNVSDPSARADKLESFYYTGLGAGFGPVVAAGNYGFITPTGARARRGQIRTDFFLDREWNLREFQLALGTCLGSPTNPGRCSTLMQQVTVKVNPAEQLFDGTNSLAPSFQSAFLGQIPALAAATAATIGMTNGDQFNTMESVSTDNTMDYNIHVPNPSPFRTAVENANASLSASEVFLRATTQTCAGCHELSTNDCLGPGACPPGIAWPDKFKFTQIDEVGTLSAALTSTFLPFRKTVLQKFLNAACNGLALSDGLSDRNLAGGSVDAPN